MDRDQRHIPVILLMDNEVSTERTAVREWFENSRFATLKASDVFEALEEISDFTMKKRPDVILVDVDCCDDELPIMRSMTALDDLPIMALSSDPSTHRTQFVDGCFQGDLGQVVSHLDELIPATATAKTAL